MSNRENPLSELPLKFLFLVWGTPDQGPRSRVMAEKLGFEVHFVETSLPRGSAYAFLKYMIQAIKTVAYLFRTRPNVVFVQSPPLFAAFFVYIYCALTGSKYIVDAHSAAFSDFWWDGMPTWLNRLVARKAITTMVTNEYMQQMIQAIGGHSLVVRDVPTTFQVTGSYPVQGRFNVAMVNTFAPDEPLAEVLQAATQSPEVHFYVTGKLKQNNADIVRQAPTNVHFTDFLPNEDFYSLLNTAQAVMCLTTRNHTMQRGACEALSLGKPIITSNWPLLRQYFNKGTMHVNNDAEDIRRGVIKMKADLDNFEQGIKELQIDQQQEWQEKIRTLVALINA